MNSAVSLKQGLGVRNASLDIENKIMVKDKNGNTHTQTDIYIPYVHEFVSASNQLPRTFL